MKANLAWKNLLMRHNLGRESMKHHKKGFNAVKHPPHCCLKLSPWEKADGEESVKNDKIAFYSFSFVPFLALKPAVKLLSRKNNFSRAVKVPFPTHRRWTVFGEFDGSKGETSGEILSSTRIDITRELLPPYLEIGGACWDVCWLSVVEVDGRIAVAAWLLSCV